MNNVVNIQNGKTQITMKDVVDSIQKDHEKFDSVFCVAFVQGRPNFYLHGKTETASLAAAILQDWVIMMMKGQVEP